MSSSKVPWAAIWPSLNNMILSQLLTVPKRWAIIMTVEFFNFSCTVDQMVFSVFGSTCAVGSSKITILLRLSKVRAKHINCRSPVLKFSPPSKSWWSSWPSRFSTKLVSFTSLIALHSSSSVYSSKGSKFFLNDPLKRTGDWPRTEIHFRDSWSWTPVMHTPSMNISPSASGMRRRADIMDDFPSPVRPTIPNLFLGWISKVKFLSTTGPPG